MSSLGDNRGAQIQQSALRPSAELFTVENRSPSHSNAESENSTVLKVVFFVGSLKAHHAFSIDSAMQVMESL